MAFIQIKIEEYNGLKDSIKQLQEENVRLREKRDEYAEQIVEYEDDVTVIKSMPFFSRLFNFKKTINNILNKENE